MPDHLGSDKDPLVGRRLLVVEDDEFITLMIEEMLALLGCEVAGKPSSPTEALAALAASQPIDGAILDLKFGGKTDHSVADELAARGVPFLFVTGYDRDALAERHRDRPLLRKPFRLDELAEGLKRILLPV